MGSPRFLARASLAASLLAAPGCSLALQTDAEQCTVDTDCTKRGGMFAGTICAANVCVDKPAPVDPKWGCIGKVPAPVAGKMDTLEVQLEDLITEMPPKGVTVTLCNKYDTSCATPLGTPVPDAMGFVTATLQSDQEAYLLVSGGDYEPSIVFLDHLYTATNMVVSLVPTGAAMGFATTAGVTLDPTKAILLVATVDCTGARSAGVSVSLSPKGMETGFYVINQAVTTNATSTDSAGNSGFVNVDPGPPTVTSTIAQSGEEIGKLATLVRAGYLTFQILGPTPTL
jgi:hypothetical protein